MINALTIDVEDYFQVSAFEAVSAPESWEGYELRVERSTDKVLAILEEAGVHATFFVLGWIAAKVPHLVRAIVAQGHEVASHGYGHRRVSTQSRQEFRMDVRRSKDLLEDLTSQPVLGYRAPSYSIGHDSLWAFDELAAAGYLYDSSVFPVKHDFYGISDWPRFPFGLIKDRDGSWTPESDQHRDETQGHASRFQELPITTLRLLGRNLPIAGGGYFRLYPYELTRWGLQQINVRERQPFIFYLHPWELDPGQPRMAGASWKSRTRHYLNLGRTEERFRRLLGDFEFSPSRELLAVPETVEGLDSITLMRTRVLY